MCVLSTQISVIVIGVDGKAVSLSMFLGYYAKLQIGVYRE